MSEANSAITKSTTKSANKSALARYQHKPFLGSSHSWAIEIMASMPKDAKVLDIGCGSSPIGKELKARGFTSLTAVEVDQEAKRMAQEVYHQVVDSHSELQGNKYGIVLLLDVIEHLADPDTFLTEVTALLNDGGTFLISVPNVAHWSVRIPLLFGIFNYTDRAILDRTHLQFFTRSFFKKLITNHKDLSLTYLGATIEPAEFVLPKAIWDNSIYRTISKVRLYLANLLPGLMAYQHVAILKKK